MSSFHLPEWAPAMIRATATLFFAFCFAPPLPARAESGAFGPVYVSFFSGTSCPANWLPDTVAAGRILWSTNNPQQSGTTFGDPLVSEEDRTHRHDFELSLTLESKNICGACSCCNDRGAKARDYPLSGVTEPTDTRLPFAQAQVCNAVWNSYNPFAFPVGSIVHFRGTFCPQGWQLPTAFPAQTAFVGVPTSFEIGKLVGKPGEEGFTHQHTLSSTVNFKACSYALVAGCSAKCVGKAGQTMIAGSTTMGSAGIPGVRLLACERTDPPRGEEPVPAGILGP